MVTRITNLAIGSYQGFSVDKSLIKKLYSWRDTRKKKKGANAKGDDIDQYLDSHQKKIKDSISSRSVFSYAYGKAYMDWFRTQCYCCCCWFNCLCCKKNRRKSKQEKIFVQA
jgi:hypothetical protein